MTGFELTVVVILAIWMTVLSISVLALVRQVGLLSVSSGLIEVDDFSFRDDGPPIGEDIGIVLGEFDELTQLGPLGLYKGSWLFLSSTCRPCRELVESLGDIPGSKIDVVFVAGREDTVGRLTRKITASPHVLTAPTATDIAERLSINSVPFWVSITEGEVSNRSYVRDGSHLSELMSTHDVTYETEQQQVQKRSIR